MEIVLMLILLSLVDASRSLDVRVPPSLVPPMSRGVVYLSPRDPARPARLYCTATGHPPPHRYLWTKDGEPYNVTSQTSVLVTSPGYYQCTATNAHASTKSDVIDVQQAYIRGSNKSHKLHILDTNKYVTLPCDIQSNPRSTVTWYESGVGAIIPDNRRIIDIHGQLFFANLELDDDDKAFHCQASLQLDLDDVEGAEMKLVANGTQHILKVNTPRCRDDSGCGAADVSPQIMSLEYSLKEDTLRLQCLVHSRPISAVGWMKDGVMLPLYEHSPVLVIHNAGPLDRGRYTCIGRKQRERDTGSIDVNFTVPPQFTAQNATSRPVNQNVTEGSNVQVNCITAPNATVTWYINGNLLNVTSLPPRLSLSADVTTLTLTDVCKTCADGGSDVSDVACNASTEVGYVYETGYVNVLEKTTIVSFPNDTVLAPEATNTFHCEVSNDDSTPASVTWYLNSQPISGYGDSVWVANGNLHISTRDLERDSPDEYSGQPISGSGDGVWVANGKIDISTRDQERDLPEEYSGNVSCVATNGYSEDTASFLVLKPTDVVTTTHDDVTTIHIDVKPTDDDFTKAHVMDRATSQVPVKLQPDSPSKTWVPRTTFASKLSDLEKPQSSVQEKQPSWYKPLLISVLVIGGATVIILSGVAIYWCVRKQSSARYSVNNVQQDTNGKSKQTDV